MSYARLMLRTAAFCVTAACHTEGSAPRSPTPGRAASASPVSAAPPAEAVAPSAASAATATPADAKTCANDDREPDHLPNVNDTAHRMGSGKMGPMSLIACPGDVDYVQGVGDFAMKASVQWDPSLGALEIELVGSDDRPYEFRDGPPQREAGVTRAPGRVEIQGGNYNQFIRVRNSGETRIPYQLSVDGIWGE